jgi:hypothetical protein
MLLRSEAPDLLLDVCTRHDAESLSFLLSLHALTGFAFPTSRGPSEVWSAPKFPPTLRLRSSTGVWVFPRHASTCCLLLFTAGICVGIGGEHAGHCSGIP